MHVVLSIFRPQLPGALTLAAKRPVFPFTTTTTTPFHAWRLTASSTAQGVSYLPRCRPITFGHTLPSAWFDVDTRRGYTRVPRHSLPPVGSSRTLSGCRCWCWCWCCCCCCCCLCCSSCYFVDAYLAHFAKCLGKTARLLFLVILAGLFCPDVFFFPRPATLM